MRPSVPWYGLAMRSSWLVAFPSASLVVTILALAIISILHGERGYCRLVHLVIKPVVLGALALVMLVLMRRHDVARWRPWKRAGLVALCGLAFAVHLGGALFSYPGACEDPVCQQDSVAAWTACFQRALRVLRD